MSQSSAWFPCYVNDLLGSIRWKTMTPSQRGAYWQLICWQMQGDDGHLPPDHQSLSALSDLDLSGPNSCVLDAFPVQENGRRANGRALREWYKRKAISGERSQNGTKGAASRWQTDGKCHGNTVANETTTTTTTTVTPTVTITTPLPPSGGMAKKPRKSSGNFRVSENTPVMVQIGAWFKRQPTTLWTVSEKKALDIVSPTTEEISIIGWLYGLSIPKDSDYRRRSLPTLLNNWQGEVDKANRMKMAKKSTNGNITE